VRELKKRREKKKNVQCTNNLSAVRARCLGETAEKESERRRMGEGREREREKKGSTRILRNPSLLVLRAISPETIMSASRNDHEK